MDERIVIGIDGGGTYTRIAAADLQGNILGFSKKPGSHPGKNSHPEKNIKEAVMDTLQQAERPFDSVAYIVAGLAGLNNLEDRKWARKLLSVSGIKSPAAIVNDAEIAQYGAFLGKTGVLALAGTGSIVLGKTEEGSIVRNYDFHHDSEAGARYLSYSAIYSILSGAVVLLEDELFVRAVLKYWNVKDIEMFRSLASKGYHENNIEAVCKLSEMGPMVTTYAEKGSKIAQKACEKARGSLITGIHLVSSMFSLDTVPLSFVGGVANDSYIDSLIKDQLDTDEFIKVFEYKRPELSPVLGAVLYAYHELGINVNSEVLTTLVYQERNSNFY